MLALGPTFDGKRTIPSPAVTALMLDLLQLSPTDKLLEVGTGSGSQTKAFAQTGATVHSVELEPWIDTTVIVGECVYLHTGDGGDGLSGEAPFTAIVASCGVEQIPRAWLEQLSDGGRLVVPIGDSKCQRLTLFRKQGDELVPERIGGYVKFQMLRPKPKVRPAPYQAKGYPYALLR
jgi:protein-L-isoaspartate(D-aspartate) O-methyltransferase